MKTIDILLPCLNEEKTLEECIKRIQNVIENDLKKYKCRIVVCDNNSTDSSIKIAKKNNVIVFIETEKGYGATLLNGIKNSNSDYIVMLDCDLSYNEKDIPRFIKELENGYDLVMGNRFLGNIEEKAMPRTHSIGSRLLTVYANILFHTPSNDFHSGLRAFKRESFLRCDCKTNGFEFASEMIIEFQTNHFKIKEISTDLFVDGRNRKPHLKSIKDGLRHLKCITHLKNEKSIIFRYSLTLLIYTLILGIILLGNIKLSNNRVENNKEKSIEYLKNSKTIIINTKEDIKLLESNKSLVLRYYLNLFSINNTSYLIIILGMLFLIGSNLSQLFKISKILAISYLICIISMILSYKYISIKPLSSFIVSLLFTRIIIQMFLKGNIKIGLFFSLNGFISAILNTNMIPLLFPLLIYLYIIIEEKKYIDRKQISYYIIIWLVFYFFTWILISIFHQTNFVTANLYSIKEVLNNIKTSLNLLIPFSYIEGYGYIIILILFIIFDREYVLTKTLLILPFLRNIFYLSNKNSYLYIEYYILLLYIYVQVINSIEEWVLIQKANYIIKRK